jgi:putative membrane protein
MKFEPNPQQQQLFELRRLVLRWLTSTLAIFVAVWLVPGIIFEGPGWQLGIVAVILGLLGTLLRPLLLLFTLPLVLLTLGLFVLVINAGLLLLTSSLAGQFGIDFTVESFWSALFGGLLISIVSGVLNLLAGEHNIRFMYVRGGDDDHV